MINTSIIIDKLKKFLALKTDTELANYLGIHHSTLAGWKMRETINIDIILEKVNNIDLNWLLYEQEIQIPKKYKSEKPEKIKVNEEPAEYSTRIGDNKKEYTKIPVFHGVSAGKPTQHYDSPKEFIRLDHIVNKNYVGITVNTSDYKDYGFEKGDILLVDTMRAPMNENLVLIDINNSYGLFVYLDKGKEIEIKNFNDGKINQFNEDMTVIGVVVSKMKKLL